MSRAISHYRILEKLGGDGIGWTAGTQTQWWMNMTIDDERPFTDDMKRIVAEQKLAFVATVCPDGTPNLSPKGTIAVWDDTHLVFADIRSPGTVANLKVNPTIEINVVDPFVRKGYRFKGTAELVTDGDLFQKMLDFYRTRRVDTARTRPQPTIRAFVLVTVTAALPVISPAYDDGADESVIRASWVAYFRKLNEPE
jgi:predicted pyridoxine 5'-phosphate oxidase superfamily flavin-nucleotide-binding protein